MPRKTLLKTLATIVIASSLMFGQDSSQSPQQEDKPSESDLKGRGQEGTPAGSSEPTAPTTLPAGPVSAAPPAIPADPEATAWELLDQGAKDDKTADRATAIRVLGLIPNNVHAVHIAETALVDDRPEVRRAAAEALGQMQSRSSIPKLRSLLSDDEISVALAAANALESMHDPSGYDVYYEILTGERKTSKGVIAEQVDTLKDPKKLAMIGFEEGIGFVPFAGIGWEAYRRLGKSNDASPVRAAAAKQLGNDPDPASTRALADAVKDDKNWIVRASALEAIAKRGDPSLLSTAEMAMSDEDKGVKYTAAATVLHLLDVKKAASTPVKEAKTKKKKAKKEAASTKRSHPPSSDKAADMALKEAR
jgi:HEAT repeat protein